MAKICGNKTKYAACNLEHDIKNHENSTPSVSKACVTYNQKICITEKNCLVVIRKKKRGIKICNQNSII